MNVLITGAGGMTGAELERQSLQRKWRVAAYRRSELDITDRASVDDAVARAKPDVIFNAAAYTAVDQAESEPETAMAVNAAGATDVARAAHLHGAAIIHISTDYVFSGDSPEPYKPDDRVSPINVYGESKLAGENGVRDECERHVIVRTSWVFSHTGKNFVRTILRTAGEGRQLSIVNDQFGRPTSAADLAASLICVAESLQAGRFGTYHFANAGPTTWYDFAVEILREAARQVPPTRQRIAPMSTSEYPTAARRPLYSVLDTTSFEQTFGVTPRPWREALAETLERMG